MKKIVFLASLILVILAATVFVTKYYFHRGKVFGDIYLTMKSGDIKRVAGTDVVLYKADNSDSVLQDIRNIQKEHFKRIREAAEETAKSLDDTQEKLNDYYKYRDVASMQIAEESQRVSEEKHSRSKQLIAEYNSKINDILTPLLFKTMKSDIDGRYEFLDIPYGKYIVFSKCSVFDENVEWLYPIEVNNKENKIDLSNNNKTTVFFYSHSE